LGTLLERSALVLLVLLLAWAPLPVGSNRPWSKALLAELAAGVVLVGACGLLLRGRRIVLPRRMAVAALLAAGVLAWAWLQAGPRLPAAWAHPLWGELARAGLPVVPTVSLDPAATRTALPLLASYFLLFALAFALGQEARHARILAAGVVAVATGWALWGIVRFLAGMDLLFYADVPTNGGVSANFPNRDHFAAYANLAFLVAAARLGQRLLRPSNRQLRFRTALSEAIAYLLERRASWFAAAVVLLAASLGSTSRGGFLSLLVAFSLLALPCHLRPGRAFLP
jgi:hypothetical protein